MARLTHSRTLFLDSSMNPLQFYMVPCQEKLELKPLVEHGSGIITSNASGSCTRLVPTGQRSRTDKGVRASYIKDCVKQNKLLPIQDYTLQSGDLDIQDNTIGESSTTKTATNTAAPQSAAIASTSKSINKRASRTATKPSTSNARNSSFDESIEVLTDESDMDIPAPTILAVGKSRSGRAKYLLSEDLRILRYLIDEMSSGKVQVGGNAVWRSMELVKLTSHSWQSMRDHFHKQILPKIDSFNLKAHEITQFNRLFNRLPQVKSPGIKKWAKFSHISPSKTIPRTASRTSDADISDTDDNGTSHNSRLRKKSAAATHTAHKESGESSDTSEEQRGSRKDTDNESTDSMDEILLAVSKSKHSKSPAKHTKSASKPVIPSKKRKRDLDVETDSSQEEESQSLLPQRSSRRTTRNRSTKCSYASRADRELYSNEEAASGEDGQEDEDTLQIGPTESSKENLHTQKDDQVQTRNKHAPRSSVKKNLLQNLVLQSQSESQSQSTQDINQCNEMTAGNSCSADLTPALPCSQSELNKHKTNMQKACRILGLSWKELYSLMYSMNGSLPAAVSWMLDESTTVWNAQDDKKLMEGEVEEYREVESRMGKEETDKRAVWLASYHGSKA